MSQLILRKVSEAICERRNASDWPCNGLDFDDEIAKTAIQALRDLPIGTFKTATEMLVWISIIDRIGFDIATKK